ncbi:MAG: VanZ family protein [Thermoanaerobaculia bacterium]|nr:VanZ family protein [Thermoanaerobaculia bacterium]
MTPSKSSRGSKPSGRSEPSRRWTTTPSERSLWWLATAYVLGIYSGAYFLQFVLNALRDRGGLGSTLALSFAATGGLALWWIRRQRPRRAEWLLLLLAAVVYGGIARQFDVIQERIHLLQYGLLAGILLLAFEARRRRTGRGWPMAAAALWTAAIGWGDEGVQAILPNRIYDLRDVALNALSGALLLTFVGLRRWLRRLGDSETVAKERSAIQ